MSTVSSSKQQTQEIPLLTWLYKQPSSGLMHADVPTQNVLIRAEPLQNLIKIPHNLHLLCLLVSIKVWTEIELHFCSYLYRLAL